MLYKGIYMPIKQTLKTTMFQFLLMLTTRSLMSACGSNSARTRPVVIQTLDEYLNANITDDAAGMGIMVISNNQVDYLGVKGLANSPLFISFC
jgi:hypothetical protein